MVQVIKMGKQCLEHSKKKKGLSKYVKLLYCIAL